MPLQRGFVTLDSPDIRYYEDRGKLYRVWHHGDFLQLVSRWSGAAWHLQPGGTRAEWREVTAEEARTIRESFVTLLGICTVVD